MWVVPLFITLIVWHWSQREAAQTQLIEKGWGLMDLEEAWLYEGPAPKSVRLSDGLPGSSNPITLTTPQSPTTNPALRRAKLFALMDQHVWNCDSDRKLFGYDDRGSRIWIVRDQVVEQLSYGFVGQVATTQSAILSPRPCTITSSGLWKLVNWIEQISRAHHLGRLDEHDYRVLRRPLAGLCGADRRQWFGTQLSRSAQDFLTWYDDRYGIRVDGSTRP